MAWRVSSEEGTRWVAYDGTGWTADPQTEPVMRTSAGQPVPVAPMSEIYTPSSADDELGLFLAAQAILPGPRTVTGSAPAVPQPDDHGNVVH